MGKLPAVPVATEDPMLFTVQVSLTRPSEPAILDCSDVLTTPDPVSLAVI